MVAIKGVVDRMDLFICRNEWTVLFLHISNIPDEILSDNYYEARLEISFGNNTRSFETQFGVEKERLGAVGVRIDRRVVFALEENFTEEKLLGAPYSITVLSGPQPNSEYFEHFNKKWF